MNERIRIIRDHFNMTQEVFAKSIGMGHSTLGMMEVGKRDILERHIKTICSIFNINEVWFRTGEGEMLIETKDSFIASLVNQYNLDNLDMAILESYISLSTDDRAVIKKYIQSISVSLNDEIATTMDDSIDKELESYRLELEAEKKGEILSVSESIEGKSS